MCGIAGIIAYRRPAVARTDLEAMARAIAHRGPDGQGIWISGDGHVGLAHRRLAIIDPTPGSDQPLHSPDGRYSLVYNGEIYNFLELKAELQALGSQFRTDGDSEVVIEAWRHWGLDMLPRMNGMWALALHDHIADETIFARDRFGVKPLYFARGEHGLAFASEIRGLQPLAWLSHRPDLQVAGRTLFDAFSVEGGERTLIEGVRRLPAGHVAVLHGGEISVRRWWRTCDNLQSPPAALEDQVERFRELFLDAVRLRMRSDVPIGTCLSGGFDSTAITCAISHIAGAGGDHLREAADWRHAFVASFPGMSNDETDRAREAAAFAGIAPDIMTIGDDDATGDIDQVLEDMGDVYIMLPTAVWRLYRTIRRRHVAVTLDGHGADELMGGYRQQGASLAYAARNLAAVLDERLHPFLPSEWARSAVFNRQGLQFLRGHSLTPPAPLATPFDRDVLPGHWGAFDRRLYRMFHATILPTVLRNFDRMSMAHGVEVRMPFMDYRLVTYVMSLPQSAKVHEGATKHVAREAMRGLMPESIRTSRLKVGFASPMTEWMNGAAGPWSDRILETPNAAFEEIVDVGRLRERLRGLTANRAWTWRTAEHLWPYVHMKWQFDRLAP